MLKLLHLIQIFFGAGLTFAGAYVAYRAVRWLEGRARRDDLVIAVLLTILGLEVLIPRL